MKRLIVNFRAVEATEQNVAHSAAVASRYAAKHPDADRVSINWNNPASLYAFTGKRHWDSVEFYEIEWVVERSELAREEGDAVHTTRKTPRTIPPD